MVLTPHYHPRTVHKQSIDHPQGMKVIKQLNIQSELPFSTQYLSECPCTRINVDIVHCCILPPIYICSISHTAAIIQTVNEIMHAELRDSANLFLADVVSPEKGSGFNEWTDKSFFLGRGWLLALWQSIQQVASQLFSSGFGSSPVVGSHIPEVTSILSP